MRGHRELAPGCRGTLKRLTALVTLLLFASAVGAAQYTLTDLGTVGGEESEAYAINDRGAVVGWSQAKFDSSYGGNPQRAFLYSGGTIRDLGTLGGCCSHAYGINNKGWVVGRSDIGGGVYHAFLYRDGTMHDLGTMGGLHSMAFDINDNGDVIGYSNTSNGGTHAFLYSGGVMQDLGTLGSNFSVAHAINDRGHVVGHSQTVDNVVHGFLYSAGTMANIGYSAYAYDIANDGNVVGVVQVPATLSGDPRAYRYDGTYHNLGTLGGNFSEARGINEIGQIVGHSQISGPNYAAFLYEGGAMVDLNTVSPSGSTLKLRVAHDINESGSIVGQAIDPNGKSRAFLLQERQTPRRWATAYTWAGIGADDIKLLRLYRDRVLAGSDQGQKYTATIYRHSKELLAVLLERQDLLKVAGELFVSNRANLQDVIRGRSAQISRAPEVAAFLGQLAESSPRELGMHIGALREDLVRSLGAGKEFLGFVQPATENRVPR